MKDLKQLDDGRYFAFVGYKKPGSNQQHKFFFGRDESAAIQRVALVRSLWKHTANIHREVGGPLIWDEIGLGIACEIAAGQTTISVKIDPSGLDDVAVGVLAAWQDVVPGVRLKMLDLAAEEAGSLMRRKEAEHYISMSRELLEQGGSQKLHEAIKAYASDLSDCPISKVKRLCDIETRHRSLWVRAG